MADDTHPIYAAVDAGGTTFKCAIGNRDAGLMAIHRIKTSDPSTTLDACRSFFNAQLDRGHKIRGLGLASFGPLNVDIKSSSHGTLLKTPKPGWSGVALKQYFENAFEFPVAIDTDVNSTLCAEMAWGAAQDCSNAAYLTIGTGIGAGIAVHGALVGRPRHPEFGHICVSRHPLDTDFQGTCPFHPNCLEGLASAPALTKRFGNPIDLPTDHIGWEIIAYYLAQACLTLNLTLRPERIIFGGGLMEAQHLLALIRQQYSHLMSDYLNETIKEVEGLIVGSGLGKNAGIWGALKVAGV